MTARVVAAALRFATKAHRGQPRKYTGRPYIEHPIRVAQLCLDQRLPDAVIAAAFLHDVVEDCGVSILTLACEFGADVAQLVSEVTDVSRPEDGNRDARKAKDRAHYASASPHGMSIKLADLIDNTHDIVPHDPEFARLYLAEKRLLLPLLKGGNKWLWRRANALAHVEIPMAA